jgi:hypothetical protein
LRMAAAGANAPRSDESYIIHGLSGRIKNVYTVDNVDMTFADLHKHFNKVLAVNMDSLSAENGTEQSAIIGMHTLIVLMWTPTTGTA